MKIALRQEYGAAGEDGVPTGTSPLHPARPLPAKQGAACGRRALTVVAPGPPSRGSDVARLVELHLSLVEVLVAERLLHVPAHVRRDELMSAGMLALVLSAGVYDPARGVPFRRFAAFRIRGALIDELRAMDWASRSVRSRAREVEIVRAQLTAAMDRQPEEVEITGALGISSRELDAIRVDTGRATVLSLQGLSGDALADKPAGTGDCPESLILYREELGYLHHAVAALPERLQFVVTAHFFEQRKMVDIALELSVTQSRVSQLCSEAIALIREGMNSQLNPDAGHSTRRAGRAGAALASYCRGLADRTTIAGRLDMSTALGDMRREAYPAHREQVQEIA